MRVFNGNPGQSVKLNFCQSAFAAKSLNLMSAECTTPTVYINHVYCCNHDYNYYFAMISPQAMYNICAYYHSIVIIA